MHPLIDEMVGDLEIFLLKRLDDELAIDQVLERGFARFLFAYVWEYLRLLRERGRWDREGRTAAYLAIGAEREARAAEHLEGEEADALGAPQVGSEHLLLGIQRVGDDRAAASLMAEGVSIYAARTSAQPTVETGRPSTEAVTAYAR